MSRVRSMHEHGQLIQTCLTQNLLPGKRMSRRWGLLVDMQTPKWLTGSLICTPGGRYKQQTHTTPPHPSEKHAKPSVFALILPFWKDIACVIQIFIVSLTSCWLFCHSVHPKWECVRIDDVAWSSWGTTSFLKITFFTMLVKGESKWNIGLAY